MQPIPLPLNQKIMEMKGGYVKNGFFIPVADDWLLSVSDYKNKGFIIGNGKVEINDEIKTFYMNETGEWINIDTLQ